MATSLAESVDHCEALARRTAKNFFYSFLALPKPMRRDMCVLYAYMRICDDIGDAEDVPTSERLRRLDSWQADVTKALNGDASGHAILPALVEMVGRHELPANLLYAVIDGMRMDMEVVRIQTFDELQNYCYHVAGVVGLCCIHIWGYTNERAKDLAVDCGLAFQLTNILRDIDEDLGLQRIYLPAEDLRRFGLTEQDLIGRSHMDRFSELMRFQIERAQSYYDRTQELFDHLEPTGRPILWCMMRIYHGLLERISRNHLGVFERRISVPKWKKMWFVCQAVMSTRMSRPKWTVPGLKDSAGLARSES